MLTGKMPDVTLAQLTAALTWVVSQALAAGVIDGNRAQLLVSVGSTVIAAAWTIADAVIRNGRAKALAANPALSSGAK